MKPIFFHTNTRLRKLPIYYLRIALFTFGPFLIALLAGLAGRCMGCNINEAGTDECIRLGIPFGAVLNPMVVIGWLFIFTVPIGGISFTVFTIAAIHDWIYLNSNDK